MINFYYFFDFIFSYINYLLFYFIFYFFFKKNEKFINEEKQLRERIFLDLKNEFIEKNKIYKENLKKLLKEKNKNIGIYKKMVFFKKEFTKKKYFNILKKNNYFIKIKEKLLREREFLKRKKIFLEIKEGFKENFKEESKKISDFFLYKKFLRKS